MVRVIRVPSAEEIAERWGIGMLATPPIPCPMCGRRTRAKYHCQWCKKVWTHEELERRKSFRITFYDGYPDDIKQKLHSHGHYELLVP